MNKPLTKTAAVVYILKQLNARYLYGGLPRAARIYNYISDEGRTTVTTCIIDVYLLQL